MAKWSTEVIKELLAQVDKTGVMPRDNPFYMGDIQWRKPNLQFSYTKKELLEMAKCQINILHFSEEHCEVMTDEGNRRVKMRDYQKKILLQYKKYRFNVFLASRQIGKCVTFDTEVEIFDSLKNKYYSCPIFELHYEFKSNRTWWDNLEWTLYKALYKIKKKIQHLEVGLEHNTSQNLSLNS